MQKLSIIKICVQLIIVVPLVLIANYVYSNYHMLKISVCQVLHPQPCSFHFAHPSNNSNAFRDLTFEFESELRGTPKNYSVLEALRKDGYSPRLVSLRFDPCRGSGNRSSLCQKRRRTDSDCSVDSADEISTTVAEFVVPNVVHYIFLGTNWKFTFIHYLSFRSVDRFIKPEEIFIHGDVLPVGSWWNRTVIEVKNMYHVKVPYSTKALSGQPYWYPQHLSDTFRQELLLLYGGIYLDTDVLVLKSFDPLRIYQAVFGRENSYGICSGIILARRGAPFVRLLLEQYRSYKGVLEWWAKKAVWNVHTLAELYPHLVHVEEKSLNRPSWQRGEINLIYEGKYDWKDNYAIHTWARGWPKRTRPVGTEDILTKDTTFGEISRLILYCSSDIKQQQ